MFKSQIKLTVLKKLNEKNHTGYDLMKELGQILGKKPSPGYIYPLLKDLKSKNFIKETQKGKKKIYQITKQGKFFLGDLLKKREEAMQIMLKSFEPISDKKEIKNFQNLMKKFNHEEARDYDLWLEFKNEITEVMKSNYKKKRTTLRSILNKAIKELKILNRR